MIATIDGMIANEDRTTVFVREHVD